MCLILTFAAALLCSVLWLKKDRANAYKIGTLALMFWGASLMWLVDCAFAAFGGEGFFDLSLDDALLGLLIIACGIILWAFLLAFSRLKKATNKYQTSL